MKRKLIIRKEKWPIKGSFKISRSNITEITVVKVSITENGFQGYGECRPYSRYNETPESVIRLIESVRTNIGYKLGGIIIKIFNCPRPSYIDK